MPKAEHEKALNDFLATAWCNRGNAWLAKAEYKKAIADFDEAIHLKPGYKEAIQNREIALARLQDTDQQTAPDIGRARDSQDSSPERLYARRAEFERQRADTAERERAAVERDAKTRIKSAERERDITKTIMYVAFGIITAVVAILGVFIAFLEFRDKDTPTPAPAPAINQYPAAETPTDPTPTTPAPAPSPAESTTPAPTTTSPDPAPPPTNGN